MEIIGKIIRDLPEQGGVSKAGNNWRKKEWVLETIGQYPRIVKFEFFGDRIDNNKLEVGKTYSISYDLESREFNGRWYTDVRAFASRESNGNEDGIKVDNGEGRTVEEDTPVFGEDESQSNDDLPF